MYRSKHAGGGRMVVFEQRMHTALVQRRSIEADLRHTVDAQALRVEFQPIVNLHDYQIHSAEALVRWDHPIRGAVAPTDFIPLAEETGLIVPLGRQVLAEACAQAETWPQGPDGRSPHVSVNISARQLLDPSFVADLHHILADSTLDPTRLILEITESTIVSDLDSTLDVLSKIREIGVRLAIDDFGTGYSSLSYLRMLPVDILKIDRSFVENIVVSRQGPAFVRAIVRLAKALSMTAVAEGVETQEQAQALRETGCNLGQGFLFAVPMPGRRLLSVFDKASKGSMPALQL
jgi:EAL domain-containing protein (putative c-di-GMP-specific phosphodiesterase class I)